MTKKEVQQRILQIKSVDGKLLPLDRFDWDPETKTFSSKEPWLGFHFPDVTGITFNTGPDCTFKTGYKCTFNTGSACTWIIEGKEYAFPPLFIQGSVWPANVWRPGTLRIGCEEHTFDYWLKNAKEIVAEHKVPQKYAEYIGLIKVAYEWAKLKGWDK